MNAPLKTTNSLAAVEDSSSQVFAEYMAGIIKQIPVPGTLSALTNTEDAQVSFYYQSPVDNSINASIYNNILALRVHSVGELDGVNQAELLTGSTFVNAYHQLYLSLIYQLSQSDQATYQQLLANVSHSLTTLTPIWNSWVDAWGSDSSPAIKKLSANTNDALIYVTGVLNAFWLNPAYKATLQADPGYPYEHINNFDQIYSLIPLTVPTTMRDQIKAVWNAQGAAGGLTAQQSSATQTKQAILYNIQKPSADNGGMILAGGAAAIPGLVFTGTPDQLTNELKSNPPNTTFTYSATVSKAEDKTLTFNASVSGGIRIPIDYFFTVNASGGASSSIFNEDYCGSDYSVSVVVNNPTTQPLMSVSPLAYNISNGQGWFDADPIKQALANGNNTNVTGWVFDGGAPKYDFGKNGDFGYVKTLILSQFLEIHMTFKNCSSTQVKQYFEQHSSSSIKFCGIKIGSASESSSTSYSYSNETESTITVTMKPNAPGYVPGTTDITQSLCALVAVGINYPFA